MEGAGFIRALYSFGLLFITRPLTRDAMLLRSEGPGYTVDTDDIMTYWREARKMLLLVCIGVCIGIVPSALYVIFFYEHDIASAVCAHTYPHTNRTLDCGEYDTSATRLRTLNEKLHELTAAYVKNGKAERVSIWVRDLETKQWAASNESETYIPASLMKVPLLITYYKLAQLEPGILSIPLTYAKSDPLEQRYDQNFAPSAQLTPGSTYTVEQLLEALIVRSDNNAAEVLLRNLGGNTLNETLIELGVKIPVQAEATDFVTVKTYANIFRTLYNASYLNREYSEKALALLSKPDFSKGLIAGVPIGVVVAQKFGEREIKTPDGKMEKRELHDCGIVYKKDGPYSICIMTEGDEFDELLSIIQELSKIVYEGV